MGLNLIYHFHSPQNGEGFFRPASYQLIFCFTDQGFLEKKQLQELCKSIPEADHHLLTFPGLDDLKDFAIRIAQEVSDSEVRLISVQDYNIGLDGVSDFTGYQTIFNKFGEVVLNASSNKKKGLFGKFFS